MKLKVLNLNAWLLPLRLSRHNTKRIERMFTLIKQINPDLVTFQEVWDMSYLEEFTKRLPEYYLMANPNRLFNRAGLITLSKHPVLANRLYYFKPTHNYSFFEKNAKKGFMVTRINYQGKPVDIVNTHLYISDDVNVGRQNRIAINQFTCMQDFFAHTNIPIILCGDLNIDFATLQEASTLFTLPHTKPLPTYSLENKYANAGFNTTKVKTRQLDYVLVRNNGTKLDVKLDVIDHTAVSDHHPLYAEVSFNT